MTTAVRAQPTTDPAVAEHHNIHPRLNIAGCDLCVQPVRCRLCDLTRPACADWAGHDAIHRASETSIRRTAA